MEVKAFLYKLELGERIEKGDWWQRYTGEFEQRDSVRWREKLTKRHAPHFRIIHLKVKNNG